MLLNRQWQIAINDNCSEIQEWVEEESKMREMSLKQGQLCRYKYTACMSASDH